MPFGYIAGYRRPSGVATLNAAQKKALKSHRQRRRVAGVVRVEVQAPASDAPMLKQLAAVLREGSSAADEARERLRSVVSPSPPRSVFDIFGSDLPDEYFDGVFEGHRGKDTIRDVDL